jgi:N-acetyl-anhydromuramyl-L-alanine amidase AmpD
MARRKSTRYIVLHVSAIRPHQTSSADQIDAWHKARGWNGIGYHYIIRRNGAVELGRPDDTIGAHVAGFNSTTLGICFEGGLDAFGKPKDTRTPEQNKAAIKLIKKLVKKYPDAKVLGHRDLSPDRDGDGIIEPHEHLKACPCFDAIPWAEDNNLPAADIKGAWETRKPLPPDHSTLHFQKLLKEAGYEVGPLDGIFGPRTEAAICRFQRHASIPVTAIFDAPTTSRLERMAQERRAPIRKVLNDTLQANHELREENARLRPKDDPPSSAGLFMTFIHWLSKLLLGKGSRQ